MTEMWLILGGTGAVVTLLGYGAFRLSHRRWEQHHEGRHVVLQAHMCTCTLSLGGRVVARGRNGTPLVAELKGDGRTQVLSALVESDKTLRPLGRIWIDDWTMNNTPKPTLAQPPELLRSGRSPALRSNEQVPRLMPSSERRSSRAQVRTSGDLRGGR